METQEVTISHLVHDNGGRPFRVEFNQERTWLKAWKREPILFGPKKDNVYAIQCLNWTEQFHEEQDNDGEVITEFPDRNEYDNDQIEEKLVLHLTSDPSAFSEDGEPYDSKLTIHVGGEGSSHPHEVGNSILVRKNTDRWIWIGERILEWKPLAPIVSFSSPVGNSDVPYPFAIDQDNNIYLLIEMAVLKNCSPIPTDPYALYYKMQGDKNKGLSLSEYTDVEPLKGKIRVSRPDWDNDGRIVLNHLYRAHELCKEILLERLGNLQEKHQAFLETDHQ